jgi:Fe-S-cluster-containing dehydrogenase component
MKGIYFVENRCVGCEECVVRCQKAHDGEPRGYVTVAAGFFPFPLQCRQCQEAPCKTVCPSEALQRNEHGSIEADTDKCIGCGTCATVCPFGIIRLSPVTGKVLKCDMCADRLADGLEPACVEACPKNAIAYGEIEDTQQTRRQKLAAYVKSSLGF